MKFIIGMQVKIGDKIQNFMIGGYEYDECVIEFDEVLYAYVGVHKATGSQGLLYKHLDSLKYQNDKDRH